MWQLDLQPHLEIVKQISVRGQASKPRMAARAAGKALGPPGAAAAATDPVPTFPSVVLCKIIHFSHSLEKK